MIDHDEERRFRAIERSLERDDPAFAARIRTMESSIPSPLARSATWLTIVGLVVTGLGFLASPPFGAAGMLLAVTGLALRFAGSAFTSTGRPRGDNNGELGAGNNGIRA